MKPGRLIAVVGPSGVGKDSLIAALSAALPGLHVVRRTITRDPALGGEAFDAVSPATFAARRAAGAFCLSWTAHGLSYGIPRSAAETVAAGRDAIANLSRSILPEAQVAFPRLVVLNVTASPETLARRLRSRGRETGTEIGRRLARADMTLPAGIAVADISNDGALEDTVAQALDVLAAESA